MNVALLSEYRKFVTTRLWWVLLLVMAAYMAFIGIFLGWSLGARERRRRGRRRARRDLTSPDSIRSSVYGTAAAFGYVFPVIVGALSMTGRVPAPDHHPDLPRRAPSRTRVLVAKMLAGPADRRRLRRCRHARDRRRRGGRPRRSAGRPTLLGDGETCARGAPSLALTVWAPVGVALGSIAHQPGRSRSSSILVFTQFLEAVLRLGLGPGRRRRGERRELPPGRRRRGDHGRQRLLRRRDRPTLLPWGAGPGRAARATRSCSPSVGSLTTLRRDIT